MLLVENPFFLLGASTRDTRHRIVELAEEKSLHLDQATCSRCTAELLNPRQRLTAEIAWLPGCSAAQTSELIGAAIKWIGEPLPLVPSPLATANLQLTALASSPAGHSRLTEGLVELAQVTERIDSAEVQALLNEDRSAAGLNRIESQA